MIGRRAFFFGAVGAMGVSVVREGPSTPEGVAARATIEEHPFTGFGVVWHRGEFHVVPEGCELPPGFEGRWYAFYQPRPPQWMIDRGDYPADYAWGWAATRLWTDEPLEGLRHFTTRDEALAFLKANG